MQRACAIAYLFIAHDLPVVRDVADAVAAMHRGGSVRQGPVRRISGAPRTERARQLPAASPDPGQGAEARRRAERVEAKIRCGTY